MGEIQLPSSDLLFPYQRRWIEDEAKYAIFEKSRRIGISYCEAIASVHYCLRTGQNAWYSSTDENKGKEWVDYVKAYSGVVNGLVGEEWIDLRKSTTQCVYLPSGNKITSVSSSPKTFRGLDGRIILDEFAQHEDQEELYRAAQGAVVQRGVLRLISTHDGPATVFYRLCKEAAGRSDWSHHKVTLYDAVAQGYAVRFPGPHHKYLPDVEACNKAFIDSIRANCLSEDAFGQEFDCRPLSLKALVSADEYDRVALWDVPNQLDHGKKYNELYVGIDIGRTHDLTVLTVLERWENPKAQEDWQRHDYKCVAVLAIHNCDFPTQHAMLKPIIAHPSVQRVLVDQGAVGRALADALCDELPGTCEPANFTSQYKATIAERLAGYIQTQRVSVPKDAAVRTDFLAMQRTSSKSGNLSYEGSTRDTHCDYWWSYAMALDAAESGPSGSKLVT